MCSVLYLLMSEGWAVISCTYLMSEGEWAVISCNNLLSEGWAVISCIYLLPAPVSLSPLFLPAHFLALCLPRFIIKLDMLNFTQPF